MIDANDAGDAGRENNYMDNYQLYITSAVNNDVEKDANMAIAVNDAVIRFNSHDWGELCEEDKTANDTDLKNRDGHVLGKYPTPKGYIYINLYFNDISLNSDVACIMYPSEY